MGNFSLFTGQFVKNGFAFFCFIFLFFATYAQDVEKDFFKLNEVLYIQKYEVSNKAYNDFLENYQGPLDIELLAVNNKLWTKGEFNKSYNFVYQDFYHSEATWENYPVVNIHQIAAKAYCEWLTEMYAKREKNSNVKVIFRLPTEKEWLLAFNTVKKSIDLRNEKLRYTTDQFYKDERNSHSDTLVKELFDQLNNNSSDQELYKVYNSINVKDLKDYFQARPVDYYPETNKSPLLNMVGNVSEWLIEDKKLIASNWNVTDDQKMTHLIQSVESENPSPVIGFRVVMEVIEK